MFPTNSPLPLKVKAALVQDIPASNHVDPNNSFVNTTVEVPNGTSPYANSRMSSSKKLQDELQKTGTIMKEHEDNLNFLKAQKNQLDDAILDLQAYGEATIFEEDNGSEDVNGAAAIAPAATFEEVTGESEDDVATVGASDDVATVGASDDAYNISAIRNIIKTEMQLFNLTGSVHPSSATQLVSRDFMGQDCHEFDYFIQSHDRSETEESSPIPCSNLSIDHRHKRKHKELNDQETSNCVDDLLDKVNNFKLPKGEIMKIAAKYSVSRWTIGRMWKKIKHCLKSNTRVQLIKNKKGVCGRKKVIRDDEALRNQRNKRSLAASLGAPKIEDNVASQVRSEEETIEQILKHENSAAGIYYQVKGRYGSQLRNLTLCEDVLGVVATLGQIDDDNLSR